MRLRILLSYHYYKDTDLDALFAKYFTEPYPDVFADSGGFSAATQGVTIDWRAYTAWVKRWQHLFTTYANLDIIGDAGGTLTNQKRLEDAGLEPLPVFHTGEDWEYLEQYIESYPYIALGGMVPYMRYTAKIMPWCIQAFKLAQERAVYHGFGATAWRVVRDLPWYSVDSSSWGQGFRFGQVPLFDEKRGGFIKVQLGDNKTVYRHAAIIRKMGFDPADFAERARNDRAKICAISALSYIRAEQWLRRRHGEIHIPGREAAGAGLRQHLATCADGDGRSNTRGGNMSLAALSQAGMGGNGAGERLHLSDTSNGINFGDADAGLKLHIADARGHSGGEVAAAGAGIQVYFVDSPRGPLQDVADAQAGINIHLAEHSFDRGGRGYKPGAEFLGQ